MGERASSREAATETDLARMTELTREAMIAGAIGFGTSRTVFHQDRDGIAIPTKNASVRELDAIALGMKQASRGVLQAVFDSDDIEGNINLFRGVAERSGRPLSFSLAQLLDHPDAWKRGLDLVGKANEEGVDIKAQVIGRPTGLLIGLDLSFSPFSMHPTYRTMAHLPFTEKLAAMRDPEIRRNILSERPSDPDYPGLKYLERFDWMFPLGDPPNYEPALDSSIAARAARRGISPQEEAYDFLIANDGRSILFVTVANYADGNLEATHAMLKDSNTLLGLGDGGAHYGIVCDAGAPTHMLTYWARDRKTDRFSVQEIVRQLTSAPAGAMRLLDRGVIRPGYKADLNIIDFDRLTLKAPEVAYNLPAGARRLVQKAEGYEATLVNGIVTARNGEATGSFPGRLIRGAQPSPICA
jgi:N-acyl-D-aspartate/D-glutamate deacylase